MIFAILPRSNQLSLTHVGSFRPRSFLERPFLRSLFFLMSSLSMLKRVLGLISVGAQFQQGKGSLGSVRKFRKGVGPYNLVLSRGG